MIKSFWVLEVADKREHPYWKFHELIIIKENDWGPTPTPTRYTTRGVPTVFMSFDEAEKARIKWSGWVKLAVVEFKRARRRPKRKPIP